MPAVRRIGRPRTTDLREVFNAILYIATSGCRWRMLPNDFPPVSTVRRYFYDWRDNGLLRELNSQLVAVARTGPIGGCDPFSLNALHSTARQWTVRAWKQLKVAV